MEEKKIKIKAAGASRQFSPIMCYSFPPSEACLIVGTREMKVKAPTAGQTKLFNKLNFYVSWQSGIHPIPWWKVAKRVLDLHNQARLF